MGEPQAVRPAPATQPGEGRTRETEDEDAYSGLDLGPDEGV